MKGAASLERMALKQDQRIADVVRREQSRLRTFIRRRVSDPSDVEDILQDVFCKLLALCRILFGGLGGHGGPATRVPRRVADRMADRMADHMADRMADRMAERHMTPEERERFRQRIRERFGFDPVKRDSTGQ